MSIHGQQRYNSNLATELNSHACFKAHIANERLKLGEKWLAQGLGEHMVDVRFELGIYSLSSATVIHPPRLIK